MVTVTQRHQRSGFTAERQQQRETAVPEAKKEKQGLPHPGPHQGHSREAWWGRASPHGQTQDSPAPDAGRQSAPALSGSRGPSQQRAGHDPKLELHTHRSGVGAEVEELPVKLSADLGRARLDRLLALGLPVKHFEFPVSRCSSSVKREQSDL